MFESIHKRQAEQSRHWGKMLGITSIVLAVVGFAIRHGLKEERERDYSSYRASVASDPMVHPEKRKYDRHELPGMSIEAPYIATKAGDYGEGSLSGTYPVEFSVNWVTGTAPDADRRDLLLNVMADRVRTEARLSSPLRRGEGRHVKLGTSTGHQTVFSADRFSMIVTFGECDRRMVMVIVGGMFGIDETANHMVGSFQCKPDPKANLYRSDVAFDVKPNWKRESNDDDLTLVNENGVRVRPEMFDKAGYDEGSVADIILRNLQPVGYSLHKPASTRGDKVFWWGGLYSKALPDPIRVGVLAWRCDDGRIGVVIVTNHTDKTGTSLNEGVEYAKTARCLAAGEPEPTYPSP